MAHLGRDTTLQDKQSFRPGHIGPAAFEDRKGLTWPLIVLSALDRFIPIKISRKLSEQFRVCFHIARSGCRKLEQKTLEQIKNYIQPQLAIDVNDSHEICLLNTDRDLNFENAGPSCLGSWFAGVIRK